MRETNISSNRYIQLLNSLTLGQEGPKNERVGGFCNIIVNLVQMCALIGLICVN